MLSAFAKAVADIADPSLRRILWRSLGLTLLLYAALYAACWWLLASTRLAETVWVEWLLDVFGGLAVFAATLLLFPAAVTVVVGFFLEKVAAVVERRHYPDLPPARGAPLSETVGGAARFAAVAVALNLLALPLYFLPGTYYVVNGYLLGREYFELAASRRLPAPEMRALRREELGRLWLAGAGITVLLSVPVLNLAAPIIATAFMIHVFEALRRRRGNV